MSGLPRCIADHYRFLDGQSLGATPGASEMTPFVGIESFFLPQDVDSRLAGPSDGDQPTGPVWW